MTTNIILNIEMERILSEKGTMKNRAKKTTS